MSMAERDSLDSKNTAALPNTLSFRMSVVIRDADTKVLAKAEASSREIQSVLVNAINPGTLPH